MQIKNTCSITGQLTAQAYFTTLAVTTNIIPIDESADLFKGDVNDVAFAKGVCVCDD